MSSQNTNRAASEIRFEQHAKEMAYDRLSRCTGCQAEHIAKHYVANATIALGLLRTVQMQRASNGSEAFDEAIRYMVEQIKRNHLHDLGIELEWPNKKDEPFA